jgi:hypothetical protein
MLIRMICDYRRLKKGEVYTGAKCNNGYDCVHIPSEGDLLPDDTYCELLPDWASYPDWARWRAVDEDGRLFGYQHKPRNTYSGMVWTFKGFERFQRITKAKIPCPNWKDTLEKRPEEVTLPSGLKMTIKPLFIPFQVDFPALSLGEARVMQYAYRNMTGKEVTISTRPPEKKGPYSHSVNYESPQPNITVKVDGREIAYRTLEILWEASPTKEDEMNCPRSKELTAGEQVEEKMKQICDDLAVFTKTANERVAQLTEIADAIQGHSSEDVICRKELLATLLREADAV